MITKVEQYKKEDIKVALMALHDLAENAENCILSLQTAFIYNKTTPLKGCREVIKNIKREGVELTKKLTDIVCDNAGVKCYVSVPGHLLIIGEHLEKIADLVEEKIIGNILFSDKAEKETMFLLQRLSEILWTASSLILARNTFLGMYIEEAILNLEKMADEYATLHEERLIEGLCLPVASSVYVNMLNAIKNVAWHIKEIAMHLTG
jgi:Na+/phosphate symporter